MLNSKIITLMASGVCRSLAFCGVYHVMYIYNTYKL